MKFFAVIALFLSTTLAAAAQTPSEGSAAEKPVIHHAVSGNAEAQAAFDRGLLDYYAYNPEAAEHEFYTAADLDKHLAMAYWGIALSNAPNLNVNATDDRSQQARYAIERAKSLEKYATPEDRALIDATAARLDDTTKAKPAALLQNYSDALSRIAQANPDDSDAVALYAEAALYAAIGDTQEHGTVSPEQRSAFRSRIGALLPLFQAGLQKFPKHVGLLHFYIHAAQMAGESQLAVPAALQLAAFSFPPEDSHLTHMPGHTFFDVGMYDEALAVGTRSVAMDFADYACCHPGYYSATRYYHAHNVNFLLYAMTQTGHTTEAVEVARRENDDALLARQLVAAQKWQDVVALPSVKSEGTTVIFARGIAYAQLGDPTRAQQALGDMPNLATDSSYRSDINNAMRETLSAEIALAKHDDATALNLLTKASVDASAANAYGVEMPSLYYYSPHLALANLAIRLGKVEIARKALQDELVASPRSKTALQKLTELSPAK